MKKRILATFLSAVTLISCSSALAADYSDVKPIGFGMQATK